MTRLARVAVVPYYAQVELSDAEARDYPQWETGEEAVVALPQSVAVATREDRHGPVVIEVWQGSLGETELATSRLQHDGAITASGVRLVVGNTVGGDLHPVTVRSGRHRLRVYTSPTEEAASTVYFVLD